MASIARPAAHVVKEGERGERVLPSFLPSHLHIRATTSFAACTLLLFNGARSFVCTQALPPPPPSLRGCRRICHVPRRQPARTCRIRKDQRGAISLLAQADAPPPSTCHLCACSPPMRMHCLLQVLAGASAPPSHPSPNPRLLLSQPQVLLLLLRGRGRGQARSPKW